MATTTSEGLPLYDSENLAQLDALLNGQSNALNSALVSMRANSGALKGTAAERSAYTATATNGLLWQDTDGIKMIWRKDGSAWVPAVWRWSGTTTQMNTFTPPDGFEWYNTTTKSNHLRKDGAWLNMDTGWTAFGTPPSGWTHSSRPLSYRRVNGELLFRGSLQNSSHSGTSGNLFTLPNGFRPSQNAILPMGSNSVAVRVLHVFADGTIQMYGSQVATGWWNCDGIRLPLD